MRPGFRLSCLVTGALCLGIGGLSLAAGPGTAHADAAPGSGFGAFGLTATAPGVQFTYDYPTASSHPTAEGEVPQSLAQLQSGPQGYALASIAWPGALVANAGSLSQILGLGLPQGVASALNEPVRAEARTGAPPSTVTNTSYPGTTMTATALDSMIRAVTTVAGASGPAPGTSFGATETTSTDTLTGPSTAVATATSRVTDISLAGVVTIKSVTSTASGTTNGVVASASGQTVVQGLSIGGQPATIDQNGIHVGTAGAPANAIANQIANSALSGAGMKLAVSLPVKHVQGSSVLYNAGNLVVYWNPPSNPHGDIFTATIGGASVNLGASPGIAAPGITLPPTPVVVGQPSPPPSGLATPALPGATPTAPVALPNQGATNPVVSPAPTGGTALPIALASRSLKLPRGLSPALPILVILGSVLIAVGLRRLPDRVLEHSATTCTSGGQR